MRIVVFQYGSLPDLLAPVPVVSFACQHCRPPHMAESQSVYVQKASSRRTVEDECHTSGAPISFGWVGLSCPQASTPELGEVEAGRSA